MFTVLAWIAAGMNRVQILVWSSFLSWVYYRLNSWEVTEDAVLFKLTRNKSRVYDALRFITGICARGQIGWPGMLWMLVSRMQYGK